MIKIKEYYVVFTGTILVRAKDWNDAEREAKERFRNKAISSSRILGICNKK